MVNFHPPTFCKIKGINLKFEWVMDLGITAGADKVQIIGGARCLKTGPKKPVCALRIMCSACIQSKCLTGGERE